MTKRFRHLLILFCFLSSGILSAQQIKVHIAPVEGITHFIFQVMGNETAVMTGDSFPIAIMSLNTLEKIELKSWQSKVVVIRDSIEVGIFDKVTFWNGDDESGFKILLDSKRWPEIRYPGNLEVVAKGKSLYLYNEVHIEEYIKDVIMAEAGNHKSLEFFKVQAISARTYALNNRNRHMGEGYNICDRTHCQAYHGRNRRSDLINLAVEESRSQVVVWDENRMIDAVFSANCGGITANSEDVWLGKVDYLRSVNDSAFCEGFSNHSWHKTISKADFYAKLGKYLNARIERFESKRDQSDRVKRLVCNGDEKIAVSGEEMRRIFGLKSSKFKIFDSGDLFYIEGAGFGHGVGLCQDGAYYLAKAGYGYEEILKHYYTGVEIKLLEEVFFSEKL